MYGIRGRSVFIRSFLILSFAGAWLSPLNGHAMTFLGGVSVQSGWSARELVFASGGSTATPRRSIQTFEVGIGLPMAGQLDAGIFVTRTAFDTGFGRFAFNVLGGSLGRNLIVGSHLDIRFGLGMGNGSGADHGKVGVTEFMLFLPIPGVNGLGAMLVHQILLVEAFSAGYDVIHVNRVGLTARLSR